MHSLELKQFPFMYLTEVINTVIIYIWRELVEYYSELSVEYIFILV